MARDSADQTLEAVAKSQEELYGSTPSNSVIDRAMVSLDTSKGIQEEAMQEIEKIEGKF